MACVYIVRCNFARPDLEPAWNAWYGGPKLGQMLAKPLFISMQRFRASRLDTRRRYLALWVVESPDAFTTPEYLNDWGFAEWRPHIRDWSRDLYAAPDGLRPADVTDRFAADDTASLYVAAFDGVRPAEARALRDRAAAQRPGAVWLEAIGLDRHSPVIGLARLPRGAALRPLTIEGMQETLFEPISACARAEGRN
jgi:hypothetical protein